MDPVALTRQLIDIESITGNEAPVGNVLVGELAALGLNVTKMPVPLPVGSDATEHRERFNVLATWPGEPHPAIVFSTHIDTVPPFIPSSEDGENIHGRGSCDAKGIIAAQVAAALRLHEEGLNVGLLYVAGEERDSAGAIEANKHPIGARFLINGEPTENRLGVASKGTLRVEIVSRGRAAHSAYPELGESAIDKLLEALRRLRAMPLPVNEEVGPCTMNIGVIEGGRAPNVIPDFAKAQLMYRLVGPADELRNAIVEAVSDLGEVKFVLEIPFVRFRTVPDIPTMVAAFTTDVPALSNWGEPLLIGPGSIHVAHTEREFISKKELLEAVELYCEIARKLTSLRTADRASM
jgi:acetylornithine deacetylase